MALHTIKSLIKYRGFLSKYCEKFLLTELEAEIEAIPYTQPVKLESTLVNISGRLHPNHYLITDTQRRLIDIYGIEKEFQYQHLSRQQIGLCLKSQSLSHFCVE